MTDPSWKACSICDTRYPATEFIYGNRDNRSYCRACDKADKAARAIGGAEAARQFRDEQRAKWQD